VGERKQKDLQKPPREHLFSQTGKNLETVAKRTQKRWQKGAKKAPKTTMGSPLAPKTLSKTPLEKDRKKGEKKIEKRTPQSADRGPNLLHLLGRSGGA
jgi:hypothetical protein